MDFLADPERLARIGLTMLGDLGRLTSAPHTLSLAIEILDNAPAGANGD
jgi:hypothetical protein